MSRRSPACPCNSAQFQDLAKNGECCRLVTVVRYTCRVHTSRELRELLGILKVPSALLAAEMIHSQVVILNNSRLSRGQQGLTDMLSW